MLKRIGRTIYFCDRFCYDFTNLKNISSPLQGIPNASLYDLFFFFFATEQWLTFFALFLVYLTMKWYKTMYLLKFTSNALAVLLLQGHVSRTTGIEQVFFKWLQGNFQTASPPPPFLSELYHVLFSVGGAVQSHLGRRITTLCFVC